jgi:hypothetical protein
LHGTGADDVGPDAGEVERSAADTPLEQEGIVDGGTKSKRRRDPVFEGLQIGCSEARPADDSVANAAVR